MKRLKQWWERKRAEARLRAYGICPKHFVQMTSRYYGYDSGEPIGWTWECPRCNELRDTLNAWKARRELREAINTLKRTNDRG